MIHPEPAGDRVGDLGGVEGAHERHVAARGVGETRDRPDGSAVGVGDAAYTTPDVPSEATSPVVRPSPSAAAMLSPLPGPTGMPSGTPALRPPHPSPCRVPQSDRAPSGRDSPSRLGRRQARVVRGALARPGIEPAASRCVTSIGGVHPGESQVQVVVRQEHLGDASDEVGFVLHEPGELAYRERGDRYRTHPCGPGFGPDRLGKTGGFGGGLGVVPELGGPQRPVVGVEHDHAVLLAPTPIAAT